MVREAFVLSYRLGPILIGDWPVFYVRVNNAGIPSGRARMQRRPARTGQRRPAPCRRWACVPACMLLPSGVAFDDLPQRNHQHRSPFPMNRWIFCYRYGSRAASLGPVQSEERTSHAACLCPKLYITWWTNLWICRLAEIAPRRSSFGRLSDFTDAAVNCHAVRSTAPKQRRQFGKQQLRTRT